MSDQKEGYKSPKLEGYEVHLPPQTRKDASDLAAASDLSAAAGQRIRITLHGENFIERAMMPIIRIGNIRINDYQISPDGRTIVGFIDEMPEEGSAISIAYGNQRAEFLKGFSIKKSE